MAGSSVFPFFWLVFSPFIILFLQPLLSSCFLGINWVEVLQLSTVICDGVRVLIFVLRFVVVLIAQIIVLVEGVSQFRVARSQDERESNDHDHENEEVAVKVHRHH